MFATLLGGLPEPPLGAGATPSLRLEAMVRAQEATGLDPITDGGSPAADDRAVGELAARWAATQRLTDRLVKATVLGPVSRARGATAGQDPARRSAATLDHAETLHDLLRTLAGEGCLMVEIHEPAAVAIGDDAAEQALFREASLRLLDGIDGVHVSLAVTGGSADVAGAATLLAAPFASLAVDLIAGPDNWRLVVDVPGDRGIVCGALPAAAGSDDGPETLLWAAGYAASTGGRGMDRVGLATSASLSHLSWTVAVRKLERLGEASRLGLGSVDERAAAVDPRAVSNRSAALGRVERGGASRARRNRPPT
ncbi:MAG: hypothetical protein H0T59_02395 [Chloroflexi bacterium]|nr:hypothetical protein [Chloroflexota bacterium]